MEDVRVIVSTTGLAAVHYNTNQLVFGRACLRLLLSFLVLVRNHFTWCKDIQLTLQLLGFFKLCSDAKFHYHIQACMYINRHYF